MRSEAVVRSIHFSQICWGEKQHISIYPGVRNSEHQPAIETTSQLLKPPTSTMPQPQHLSGCGCKN